MLQLEITELLRLYSQIGIFYEVLCLCTTLSEASKNNYYFFLRYTFIDSYAYHKLILLIPQIIHFYCLCQYFGGSFFG